MILEGSLGGAQHFTTHRSPRKRLNVRPPASRGGRPSRCCVEAAY